MSTPTWIDLSREITDTADRTTPKEDFVDETVRMYKSARVVRVEIQTLNLLDAILEG